MAAKRRGMTYVGVTAHLAARINQHRSDRGSAYCRRYGIRTLVHVETFDDIVFAIAREKAIKAWKREWKIALIERDNPGWDDLFDRIM
ncbi:GIY-YIG nuclease family protein [Sphingomonas baiyangensis]|uniref:GIY-YIG nuclease family protein n=1 Tax=Sphingomonas baiyangensis TaxID=2572576 RepID=A0A4U1L9H8_9SPHN|nr:GIY-YIG nuclease family protein [Sphingomonas baiyangensis]TKD53085.1 GIY-YIG nuclease family protein [Sphingomonas baiyangensis]